MRLPYAPTSPADPTPGNVAIYERIAARRAPRPLIPLDLALLHSPPVADGWNTFIGAIRTQTSVSGALLELAICRVAVLNEAVYEWNAHAPLALKAGVTAEALERVRTAEVLTAGATASGDGLSAEQWAIVAYTDQMTKLVAVEDSVFAQLKDFFNDREVVEITATIAAYNCVSRFLVALDVGENNNKKMKTAQELGA